MSIQHTFGWHECLHRLWRIVRSQAHEAIEPAHVHPSSHDRLPSDHPFISVISKWNEYDNNNQQLIIIIIINQEPVDSMMERDFEIHGITYSSTT